MCQSRFLFLTVLLVSLTCTTAVRSSISDSRPCDFPAIYNFGDSNSDTGAISAAFWPISEPYGASFFSKPAGRQSDGRLIIDFIAEHLRLPHLNPYLDSIGSNFRHGANFATGGSTIRRPNETIFQSGVSPFSLDVQTVQFQQFITRTSELYRQERNPFEKNKLPRPKEISKALYTFDIGQADLAIGFTRLTTAQLRAEIPSIVNELADAIARLYQQGARSFWIHNTGPIGCLPGALVYVKNPSPSVLDSQGCIRGQNEIALEFNYHLKSRVAKLRTELPRAAITYVDIYSAATFLISNAGFYGFREPWRICCGLHDFNIDVWCGERKVINGSEIFGASCGSPSTYISWDGIHYTQAASQWIANHILNGSFSDPPRPISHACLKH